MVIAIYTVKPLHFRIRTVYEHLLLPACFLLFATLLHSETLFIMADYEDCLLIHDDEREQTEEIVQAGNTVAEAERPEDGEPVGQRSKRTTYLVVLCILFVELCERLTFYGVTANLVFYCKYVLKFNATLSSAIVLVFQGTCFFTPLIGGWLADTRMGRFNTIYGCSLLYTIGTILLSSISYSSLADALSIPGREGYLALSLILIAIGTGGIKANVSPMGAEQVEKEGEKMVQKFFNWFYWFIQVGALLAFTIAAYVQQEVSFFCGYLITAASMTLATILLLVGRNYYTLRPPQDRYLTDMLRIIGCGLKHKLCCKKSPDLTHWLDGAKMTEGGKYSDEVVENVKSVVRLMPIFVTSIFYWTIFGQGLTTYVLQATYMDLTSTEKFSFPAASLNLFEISSLLLLIPIIDRVVYPGMRRLGFNFTPLRRIGVGLLFAAGSVVLAGIIEVERKDIIKTHGTFEQHAFNKTVKASTMSVFYQIPQYILLGTSEALVGVTGLEFAYSQSPAYLRGLVMGVCLAMIGLGYYVASALASIVKHSSGGQWYPDNLNKGSLEYYMFLLAGLMLVNAAVFLWLAVRYRYIDHDQEIPGSHLRDYSERSIESGQTDTSSTITVTSVDRVVPVPPCFYIA